MLKSERYYRNPSAEVVRTGDESDVSTRLYLRTCMGAIRVITVIITLCKAYWKLSVCFLKLKVIAS